MRINWELVKEASKKGLSIFYRQGVRPSLRTLYYWLVSQNILPPGTSPYKGLSRKFVEWRKQGIFSWDCFEDKTRITYGSTDNRPIDEDRLENFRETVEDVLENLTIEDILRELYDYHKPSFDFGRWANQPTIVEIWVEKEALGPTIHRWTNMKNIKIRVNRGYSSWTFIFESVREIQRIARDHDIVILYLGDFDPSGLDIERFLNQALDYFEIDREKITFKRLALTSKQIEKYNLPPNPVKKADSRAKRYILLYGDNCWELDALMAYALEDFRELTLTAIDEYFDEDIYEELKERRKELLKKADKILEDIKEKTKAKLSTLLNSEE